MHPCLSCGACCAHFRVAFHWMESDACTPGGVPAALTRPLDSHRLCMRGTRTAPVRCIALDAEIGERSRCSIYAVRPAPCRQMRASWEDGRHSGQCDRARQAHGLAPLTPADWAWREGPRDHRLGDNGDSDDTPPPSMPPMAA